jgi:glycosyltransferase involved in cell wall biosynthesis
LISAASPLDVQNIVLQKTSTKKRKFIFWWQDISSLLIKNILMAKNRPLGWLAGEYYLAMERAQLRHSDKVIAIAEEFRAPYRQWGLDERKLHVLPNWAAIEEIPLLPKNNPWASRHGLEDKFVFLYSGVLALKHNPALLLALADHFAGQPQVRVVVVSQGPGADWLTAHPRPNLLVLPFQPYEEFPQVLASADVLLAVLEEQARAYSVPSKTLSYLCAGRPVLLSAPLQNQAARLLLENRAGCVTPPGDPRALCAAAQSLLENPDECRLLGQNARQYAEKTFDLGKISAQFLEILSVI